MWPEHVPVLVAGGGTVGLSAALFLAHHGVDTLVVERQAGPSPHPRATGVGARTVEFFREVGIEAQVDAAAADMSTGMLGKVSGATLATADLRGATAPPPFENPMIGVSPCSLRGTCPQHRLDTVLLAEATRRGADVRYSTRLTGFSQDADGVTATLETPDGPHVVRADYLVGADGGRSTVRGALGIGTTGPGELGRTMTNILFRADLTPITRGVRFVSCNTSAPGARGMLVTIDGATEWCFHTEDDPTDAAALVRAAVGAPDLDVEVVSALPWRVTVRLADRFADGRVLLVGDAAHTTAAIGAFGLNTGVADAHNLAWKLAAVLAGRAGPGLLASYDAERRPVAAMALDQAVRRLPDPRLHWGSGPEVEAMRREAGIIAAPIVHLGYRYDSAAVVGPSPELPSTTDVALVLDGTPGSRVPHVPLGDGGSTLDLVGSRFAVLAGPEGTPWSAAAEAAGQRLGLDLVAHRVRDPDGRWPAAAGIAPDGALLVRPDGVVAWRAATPPPDPATALTAALAQVLARPAELSARQ
ncbi:FAD-dependent monooxygenase [Pseudonocardia lacus]|uniref:FAD-dependent monooxygenase n=1 Tax=Pseudonocardia lacus TaxID=2835865 RepID=UPI001BDCF4DF|nr:FAD-dependent monooxygenase [Pseudonocardia lacus]